MLKQYLLSSSRRSPPDVGLGKGVLKICSKVTGEHPCRSVISIKLLCNFIEIKLRHGCSPVNLLHIFRIHFPKNFSGRLLLELSALYTTNPHKKRQVGFSESSVYWSSKGVDILQSKV